MRPYAAGLRVWLDQWNIQPGDSFAVAINEAVRASRFLLIVMSPDYFQSAWAQQEWQYALADEINHRNIRLIPVLYRGYEIPIILRTKHWVDFRDASQYRLLVDRLVNDLRLLALGDRPSQSGTEPPKPGERGEELDPTTLSELKKALSGRGRCVQDKARQAAG